MALQAFLPGGAPRLVRCSLGAFARTLDGERGAAVQRAPTRQEQGVANATRRCNSMGGCGFERTQFEPGATSSDRVPPYGTVSPISCPGCTLAKVPLDL